MHKILTRRALVLNEIINGRYGPELGEQFRVIDERPDDGKYAWTIPRGIPDGSYKLAATCADRDGCGGLASQSTFEIE